MGTFLSLVFSERVYVRLGAYMNSVRINLSIYCLSVPNIHFAYSVEMDLGPLIFFFPLPVRVFNFGSRRYWSTGNIASWFQNVCLASLCSVYSFLCHQAPACLHLLWYPSPAVHGGQKPSVAGSSLWYLS